MAQDNRSYFFARAEQELTAAINAVDPSVAAIHQDLAILLIAKAGQSTEGDSVTTLDSGAAQPAFLREPMPTTIWLARS